MASEKIVTESALTALASDAKRAIYDVLPGGSASGNPCTFDTDIAVPLKSLLTDIVASGGNGTPSTPIPIVGHSELNLVRCGKNLGCIKTEGRTNNGVTYTIVNNTEIAMSGTATATSWAFEQITDVTKLIYLPAGTYRLSGGESWNVVLYLAGKYIDGTHIPQVYDSGSGANITLTMPAYVYIQLQVSNGTATDRSVYPMLIKGSTETAYAPYNGTPYLVSFGQTVYGGVYDANRGKLLITKGYIDLSTLEPATLASNPVFYTQLSNVKVPASNSDIAEVISECYTPIRYNGVAGTSDTIAINTSGYLYVNTGSAMTIPSGIAVFTLATPIEIDVSELSVDTIVGTNNITSDGGGDVEVEYRESVEKYAEEHGGSATSLDSLSDVTLTTPTSGDALIYDGAKWVNGDGTRHNYSTTEKVVGTWIDGSTIYEKTINVSSITINADTRVNHSISNFSSLVGLEGHIKYGSDWLPLPYFSLTTSYQIMVGNVTTTNFLYRIGDGFNVNDLSDFYVTIRYTKAN